MKRIFSIVILLCGLIAANAQTGFGLLIEDSAAVSVCNNIVVNNADGEVNISLSAFNLTQAVGGLFVDSQGDFRLPTHSPAIDAGDNGCAVGQEDLDGHPRVVNGTVDLGAYEYPVEARTPQYAVHQTGTGQLVLCNNIIVNNPEHTAMTNLTAVPSNNILSDSLQVFQDAIIHFGLWSHSPAVDAGSNGCLSLPVDIDVHTRVQGNAIDVGAFEFTVNTDTVTVQAYTVFQDNAVVSLCNNIIINNCVYSENTNVADVAYNIVTDVDTLFTDNTDDYTPRPESEAVNAGNNACNSVEKDLDGHERISGGTIEMGAFELAEEEEGVFGPAYAVHQVQHHTLLLCNNIIVNNPEHEAETNIGEVPESNILSDSIALFCDAVLNFKPTEHSPAVDAGDNSCSSWATDIDTVTRITNGTIDIGAFEIPEREPQDSTWAGGGGGGAGGGGGGGGGSGGGGGTWYGGYAITSVVQTTPDTLTLCNNIIINNSVFSPNTNVAADSSNILTDQDSLFTDNRDDYMPRPESQAVNRGNNSCNEVAVDLAKSPRIFAETIDIGAFEQFDPDAAAFGPAYAVHVVGSHNLTLCNNIIVNNPEHEAMVNAESVPASNILSDSVQVFADAVLNFNLWSHSPAVDAGDNSCNTLSLDFRDKDRVIHDTIDVGAFEFYTETFTVDTVYAVLQTADTAEIYLCNNIVINNCDWALNANVSALSTHNILEDNDTLFEHNRENYMPRENSIAVNQGNNACCEVPVDLFKHPRIMSDTIEIGAFELYEDIPDTFICYPVHQTDTTHTLYLYNNIIINNPGHTMSAGGHFSGDHNMLEDTPDVFVNEQNNYALRQLSPAIDAGDNQWATWPVDLKDDPRIACESIVDQGAYEFSFSDFELTLSAIEVPSDNCQGYYFDLTATPGAMHYHWTHSNEDTNAVQVSPLIPTEYAVIVSNGGECIDTATVMVVPSSMMADSLGAPASMGKTFWLSYLRNHFHNPTLTLNISAEEACTGTVSNPRTGWSVSFSVADHSVTTVSVPLAQAYSQQAGVVGNYGLLVETSDTVSVYAANYNTSSFDVTDVFPVDALSNEYILQTYTPMMNAEFVIVATQDSTWVDITPSRALQGGHPAQQTYSVMLQQGQTYLGMSQYGGVLGDLSGTVIHAHGNKPVAVFNGNVCALVPTNNSYTDHLVEQAVGTNYWGRSFSITTTESQNFDVVRVTAMRNNTEIRKNGTHIATLQAYQTHEFQLTGGDGSCYLETSEPAGVYLYIAGAVQGNSQERSDPSMVWIPPTEQMLTNITFATFNSPGISDHYVNIVVPSDAVSDVTLDGVNIGGQFALLNGSSDFAFVRKHINNGTHTLHCDGGFIAHCYGLGYHESYGYAAGSKAVPLKEQLFVNGILNTELPPDTKFCPYEPIEFSTYVNYPCDSVVWNFGDGSPLQNASVAVHDYTAAGHYTVSATLYITSNGTVFCSNLYARVKVVEGPTLTFHDTVCQGDHYTSHGFDVETSESGHFTYTRAVSVPGQYCDSTFILELDVRENHLVVEDTICLGNSYQDYGFNFTPIETGLYTDTIHAGTAADGCDSLVILQLMVTPNTDTPPEIDGELYPCQGGSYTYRVDSLAGLQHVQWTVADSIIVLQQQNPYEITMLFDTYADSFAICISATGGCGVVSGCKMVYPQPYNFVQLTDTICVNETEYTGYGFTLTNISDSNDLFVNHSTAVGGCDSTTVLRLVIMPTYEVMDTIYVCENEYPYLYHDTLLADTGFYRIMLASEFGCDSLVNLLVSSKPIHHTHIYDTVCNAKDWYDSTYTISGDYDVMLANSYGCDSLVTMHLTVHHSDTVSVDSTVCRNALPIVWNDVSFSDAGEQSAQLQTSHGCDSLVVMRLYVNELTEDATTLTILQNDLPYEFNGYYYDSAGTYLQHLTNAAGCDSVLTVVLNVIENVSASADTTICENSLPFEWNGVIFEEAGTLPAILTSSNGADSVLLMTVTVIPTTYGTLDTAVVENALPLLINDSLYSSEGAYTQTLTNAQNCDSLLVVNVVVHHNVTTEADSTICESQLPIEWNGVSFAAAGIQSAVLTAHTGADSTVVMHLTVIPTTYGILDTAVVENALPLLINDSLYSSEGAYTQTLTNAQNCDSLLVVNVVVHHNVTSETDSAICESQLPIEWNGVSFAAAGTKTAVLTAFTGADSTVVMHLTVLLTTYGTLDTAVVENALPLLINDSLYSSEGAYTQTLTNAQNCDSLLVVNVVVHHNVTSETDSAICESQLPIEWNGVSFAAAGTKTAVLTAFTGADSTVVMHLTVLLTTYGTLDTAVVENALPLLINDSLYSSEGAYTQTLTNAQNCDSLLVVNVVIHHNVTSEADSTICESQLPIEWNGVSFATAGTQTALLTASTGADSTVVMHLTVHYPSDSTLYLTIYERELPYALNADTYDSAGTYTQTLTNVAGCDSTLTVVLAVIPTVYASADSTICSSELPLIWNGVEFTAAGTQTATLQAANGTDSVLTMTLTVNAVTGTTLNAEIVQNNLPYVLNDSSYTATGTYYQHFTNAAGCDSTVTLNLTVYNNTTAQVYATACASALPYTWGGHVFEAAGTFVDSLLTDHGADSVVTYTLSVDEIAATIPNVTHVTCFSGSNGAATATVTGGMPNFAYAWTDAAGASVSTTTSISNQPAGNYTFSVTDAIGCVATATVTLNTLNDALQPGTIAENQVVCEGEQPLPFTGTAASGGDNGAYQWQVSTNGTDWTPAPGTNNTQSYTYPNIPTTAFSLRRAWVSQSCGTEYSNTVNITLWPNTMDTVTAAVCQNEAFEGFGFEVTADQTAVPGDYTFEQHHATGHCDSAVVLILTVNPLFETEVEDVVCEGEGYDDNGFSVVPIETVGEQQLTRVLTLQSAAGCDSVVTLRLRVIDTAVRIVSLTPDFCEDLSAELMVVTDMPNYVWSTGETAPTITVTHSGSYYVTASQGECSNTARFVIENCDDQLLLPNAITPSNHDGLNDYFSIPERNLLNINLFEIWIYNRWGELVYYTNDKNFRWNGEYRGTIQYQTVYNYVIRYTNAAGKPEFVKGSVTVL